MRKKQTTAAQPGLPSGQIHLQRSKYMSAFVREAWGGALPYVGRAMCYDGGKNVLEKIVLKLQVKQEREGNRATSVSEQSSMWPQSVPGCQPSCERFCHQSVEL